MYIACAPIKWWAVRHALGTVKDSFAGPLDHSICHSLTPSLLLPLCSPQGLTYCIEITITLTAKTATITGYSSKLPATAQTFTTDVCLAKAKAAAAADTPAATPETATAPAPATATPAATPATAGKYYCGKGLAVSGTRLTNSTVSAGELGVADCSDACTARGTNCTAFAIIGTSCTLLRSVNTSSAAVSAQVSRAHWQAYVWLLLHRL